jgi:hypothetical protein
MDMNRAMGMGRSMKVGTPGVAEMNVGISSQVGMAAHAEMVQTA